ncbi:hypothetical protein BOX15_Mlig002315g4 [Macrostomum lignano]|uniref:Multidrug resistance protein 1 n=1 Tax=Macrostomum lignano TaxID=282301 RepID=A0A267GQD9_9PLAT|nr:hypothetical protein BOX15_Mlig002315g4 [Macrostomum lignano]
MVKVNSQSSENDDERTPLLSKDSDGKDEKPKLPPVSIAKLFRFADGLDWLCIAAGSAFAAGHGCGWPLISVIFGQMTNDFIRQGTLNSSQLPWANASGFDFLDSMNRYAIQYSIVGACVFAASALQVALWSLACERQVHRMRLMFFRAVLRQEMSWFDQQSSGELTTRLADDLEKIRDGIGDKVSLLAQAAAGFFSGFIIGFFKSWRMTLVMMSLTPLLAIGGGLLGRLISSISSREQEAYAKAGAIAEETISCVKTVMAFCGQDDEEKRYAVELKKSMKEGIRKSIIIGSGIGFVMLVLYSAYCLAFWYGATQVKEWQESFGLNGIPPGDIFTVFFCVMIGSFSLGLAGQPFSQLMSARGAAATVYDIIDRRPVINASEESAGMRPPDDGCRGEVKFDGVSFAYPNRTDAKVLSGVSFSIRPGQRVALTGPSGSGKSSIVKLLLRFYDPLEGSVHLDGHDLRDLNAAWLRSKIGVVSQEPVLFACSIADNVRMGRPEATMSEIEDACRQANAHNFICGLPAGYETLVGERGAQLSGGQKQRVALARALIRKPVLLLLDEATSALDSESEAIVQAALDKASENTTTLVVAHRLSTVRNADLILTVSEGRILEAGTHDELMERRGLYHQLVSLQEFADEAEQAGRMTGGQDSSLLNGSAANASDTEQRRRRTSTSFSKTDRVAVEIVAGALTENSKTKEEMEKAKQKEMLANSPSFFAILRMNKPEWPYILLACVGSLILGGGMPLFALFFSEVIRVFGKFGDEMLAEATFWALMFLVLGASQFVGHIISAAGMGISGERLTARLRAGYFRSMLRQDMSFFDSPDNSVGALTTRLASDASSVKGAAGVRLALPLQAIFGAGIGLGIALYYGWQLALMILGCVPLMAVAGAVHMAYQTRSQKASDKGTEMAGQTAAEAIENLPTVQSLGREEVFYTRYRDFLSEPYRKRLFATLLGGLTYGFSQSIVFFIYAASFRFGAYLVSIDQMEVNNVFKVFFSITFAGLMAGQTFSLIPDYAKARIAAGYIIALLNREPLIDNRSESGDRPQKLIGELRLVDVDFEYPQRAGTRVLRRLNLTIPAGRTVALVGPSGCGKSTVVSLLQRYYDPMTPDGELVGGRVELDGRDVRQLNLAWLRRNIRVVNQEPVLFARSIADNLTYGLNEEPESDCLEEVVRLSNISDFVKHLPDGMDTQVGEKGAQLSGGQKQRVALARALITRPKILLLDEATSALDSESEALVQAALDEARQGRTCILVAHRLSTVQSADVIVVMEGGRVVETGTHAELMRLGGAYYSMANSAMRKGGTLLPPGTG